jgi:hypothetical protein
MLQHAVRSRRTVAPPRRRTRGVSERASEREFSVTPCTDAHGVLHTHGVAYREALVVGGGMSERSAGAKGALRGGELAFPTAYRRPSL